MMRKLATILILLSMHSNTNYAQCDSLKAILGAIGQLEADSGTQRSVFRDVRTVHLGRSRAQLLNFDLQDFGSREQMASTLLLQDSTCSTQLVNLDTFFYESTPPEIRNVFSIATSQKSGERLLVVLLSWGSDDSNLRGCFYKLYIYQFQERDLVNGFSRYRTLTDRFPLEVEGYCEGKIIHAKYNTEAKIRRRLKQLGY